MGKRLYTKICLRRQPEIDLVPTCPEWKPVNLHLLPACEPSPAASGKYQRCPFEVLKLELQVRNLLERGWDKSTELTCCEVGT
jgi:hypothetical protein